MIRTFLTTVTLASLLLLAACNIERESSGPPETLPVSVDAGTSERANVELNMGAGQLTVAGGAAKLMEGTLEYDSPRLKPEITTTHNGVHATVTVRQPDSSTHSFGKTHNIWDLQVTNKLLLDMTINCGAGEAHLTLGDVLMRALTVHMGAGKVDLDLTGKPAHDYEVTIKGGVGQATVHLPQSVGIWASAHGGIGSINVTGLDKRGDHWENDLYDKAKVNVRVEVNGGIGEIRLIE